jgi:hypothetical protein
VIFFFLFLMELGFKLKTLSLQSRHSTAWATPPVQQLIPLALSCSCQYFSLPCWPCWLTTTRSLVSLSLRVHYSHLVETWYLSPFCAGSFVMIRNLLAHRSRGWKVWFQSIWTGPSCYNSIWQFYLFIYVGSTGVWTQGLILSSVLLLSHSANPAYSNSQYYWFPLLGIS